MFLSYRKSSGKVEGGFATAADVSVDPDLFDVLEVADLPLDLAEGYVVDKGTLRLATKAEKDTIIPAADALDAVLVQRKRATYLLTQDPTLRKVFGALLAVIDQGKGTALPAVLAAIAAGDVD